MVKAAEELVLWSFIYCGLWGGRQIRGGTIIFGKRNYVTIFSWIHLYYTVTTWWTVQNFYKRSFKHASDLECFTFHWLTFSIAFVAHSGLCWPIFSMIELTWKHRLWICLSQLGSASRAKREVCHVTLRAVATFRLHQSCFKCRELLATVHVASTYM